MSTHHRAKAAANSRCGCCEGNYHIHSVIHFFSLYVCYFSLTFRDVALAREGELTSSSDIFYIHSNYCRSSVSRRLVYTHETKKLWMESDGSRLEPFFLLFLFPLYLKKCLLDCILHRWCHAVGSESSRSQKFVSQRECIVVNWIKFNSATCLSRDMSRISGLRCFCIHKTFLTDRWISLRV